MSHIIVDALTWPEVHEAGKLEGSSYAECTYHSLPGVGNISSWSSESTLFNRKPWTGKPASFSSSSPTMKRDLRARIPFVNAALEDFDFTRNFIAGTR